MISAYVIHKIKEEKRKSNFEPKPLQIEAPSFNINIKEKNDNAYNKEKPKFNNVIIINYGDD